MQPGPTPAASRSAPPPPCSGAGTPHAPLKPGPAQPRAPPSRPAPPRPDTPPVRPLKPGPPGSALLIYPTKNLSKAGLEFERRPGSRRLGSSAPWPLGADLGTHASSNNGDSRGDKCGQNAKSGGRGGVGSDVSRLEGQLWKGTPRRLLEGVLGGDKGYCGCGNFEDHGCQQAQVPTRATPDPSAAPSGPGKRGRAKESGGTAWCISAVDLDLKIPVTQGQCPRLGDSTTRSGVLSQEKRGT